MKSAEIFRDTATGRLAFRVREADKTLQEETSAYSDIRKLRRHIHRTLGKSVKIVGPVVKK
jgi:hypothetical protein